MTFTDAELDQLTAMLVQTDPSRIGYSGPKAYNRDGRAAAAAITYLRAQLSERDALGAVVMRESCAREAKDNAPAPVGGPFSHTNTARVTAFDIADCIRAIPLPTHAELLAHALTLPEIKALETELKLRREIAALERLCDHDCDNEDCVRCFHYPDILEQRRAALAQMEGKE